MMQFDRISLSRQAKELGFVRDTFEKVCRLADVLSFTVRKCRYKQVAGNSLLSQSIAKKN
ncbi:MAG TPA: hypothetical protein PKH23_05910 [Bacillota bacterium]|jgi:hypothetical protein|nr:hypothetical protein [Bacillota bacterium]